MAITATDLRKVNHTYEEILHLVNSYVMVATGQSMYDEDDFDSLADGVMDQLLKLHEEVNV